MTELTILMPCLNEAATVGTCVAKARAFLARTGIQGEVLVADNGSEDGSRKLAEQAGARVVQVAERGYGAALAAGIAAASGRYVIMGDADDSYDFSRLEGFVAKLREGYPLVMGNRFKGGIRKGAMPWLHRYLGNPVLSFIGRLLFRAKVGDFHCGLRGFDREAVRGLNLRTPGMEFASELVVKATLAGWRIAEVPTTLHPDGRGRPPHLRSWHDGWRHLRFLLQFSPRWLFLYPGLTLFRSVPCLRSRCISLRCMSAAPGSTSTACCTLRLPPFSDCSYACLPCSPGSRRRTSACFRAGTRSRGYCVWQRSSAGCCSASRPPPPAWYGAPSRSGIGARQDSAHLTRASSCGTRFPRRRS